MMFAGSFFQNQSCHGPAEWLYESVTCGPETTQLNSNHISFDPTVTERLRIPDLDL